MKKHVYIGFQIYPTHYLVTHLSLKSNFEYMGMKVLVPTHPLCPRFTVILYYIIIYHKMLWMNPPGYKKSDIMAYKWDLCVHVTWWMLALRASCGRIRTVPRNEDCVKQTRTGRQVGPRVATRSEITC